MKKILLFVFAALFAYTMSAQITSFPYTESFNNGLGSWQTVDNDGDGYNWMRASELISTMSWSVDVNTYDANGSGDGLVSESYRNYVGAFDADNWLISPAIVLPAGGSYKVTWYSRAGQDNYPDAYEVYVGTSSDVATLSAGTPLYTGASESDFTQHEIMLDAFAGQTVYFAIRHFESDMYYLVIDEISIVELTTNPEIALTSLSVPTFASEGASINVSGVVTNNSAAALTSFDVSYTIDGTASSVYSVTGINIPAGGTYTFTHNAPITGLAGGNHALVVTVSNPNGTADNTADNSLNATITVCGTISVPYSYGFENGMNCWQAISMNTANNNFGINGGGQYGPQFVGAHTGDNAFIFSSYESAGTGGDYTQYLISPELNLTGDAMLTYYYKAGYGDAETMQLMVSTTDNNTSSFTALGDELTAPEDWEEGAASIAANVKYIAFKYTAQYEYFLGIDDIALSTLSLEPEIELVSAETNPNSVALNTNFNLKGVVKNHSGSPLTSFDLSYTFNNQTYNESISGINVSLGQSYNFSVPVTGIATTGNYPINVTVSNPNGVADNTSDNTQSTAINIYDASTAVDRTVLIENFTGAWCGWCPTGHKGIEDAIAGLPSNLQNRVVWVAHHNGDDMVASNPSSTIEGTFPVDGFPSAMLDRTVWDAQGFEGTPIYHPAYTTSSLLQTAMNTPAFVTVNISNVNYNTSTNALTATVSGSVTGALATSDARLNVWLLEDGILADDGTGVGHAEAQNDYADPAIVDANFRHNHVIRVNLTNDAWGESGVVTPTAGTNYTKNISTTVDVSKYDASKCYLVAFVSDGNHSNTNNSLVFNAAKSGYITTGGGSNPGSGIDDVNAMNVNLYPNPTTGNLYIDVEGLEKVEVIDMVGRVVMTQENGNTVNLSNLANGVYSVRISANGNTAVKRVVKK